MNALPAKVLVITDDSASARRLAEMLRAPGIDVWVDPAEIPAQVLPEVVVTDSESLDPNRSPAVETHGDTLGVVRIGVQGPADVCLAEDASVGELQLACRLLAEVVRLRRRERSGEQLQRRLVQEALTDPLSGLPNRRAWDQAVAERLAEATCQHRLCLAILDIDHFKHVNDAHGHAAGDEVLRAAGQALSASLRADDFVARLGGDEFGVLLSVADVSTAFQVVDRVRASLPDQLAQADTHVVTASAGFQVEPGDDVSAAVASPETFYAQASAALRRAKEQGRDRTIPDYS